MDSGIFLLLKKWCVFGLYDWTYLSDLLPSFFSEFFFFNVACMFFWLFLALAGYHLYISIPIYNYTHRGIGIYSPYPNIMEEAKMNLTLITYLINITSITIIVSLMIYYAVMFKKTSREFKKIRTTNNQHMKS